nr:hypothetical protein [Tanacetum cinerariifolium]
MSKRAPEKNCCLTVNLHHDGVFTVSPFEYSLGDEKQITDIHFEGTSLKLGIKIIKTDLDVDEFVNLVIEINGKLTCIAPENNRCITVNLHHDGVFIVSPFEYSLGDEKQITDIHFEEVDDNVIINNVTTNDPFLNKLCPDSAHFLNMVDEHVFANDETVNWKKMEPVLVMRFDNPEQLKMCLENYGVANGYQLWFYRIDWKKLLVYCGRDVEAGRCAGYDSMKKKKKTELGENESLNVMKNKKKTELGENESLNVMKNKKKTELGENESLNVNKVVKD